MNKEREKSTIPAIGPSITKHVSNEQVLLYDFFRRSIRLL